MLVRGLCLQRCWPRFMTIETAEAHSCFLAQNLASVSGVNSSELSADFFVQFRLRPGSGKLLDSRPVC